MKLSKKLNGLIAGAAIAAGTTACENPSYYQPGDGSAAGLVTEVTPSFYTSIRAVQSEMACLVTLDNNFYGYVQKKNQALCETFKSAQASQHLAQAEFQSLVTDNGAGNITNQMNVIYAVKDIGLPVKKFENATSAR